MSIIISCSPIFDGNKLTVFLVHGWLGSKDNRWLLDMKDYILQQVCKTVTLMSAEFHQKPYLTLYKLTQLEAVRFMRARHHGMPTAIIETRLLVWARLLQLHPSRSAVM